jgi:hypothetical protein
MKLFSIFLTLLMINSIAFAYSTRLVSSRTYEINVNISLDKLSCDSDFQTVDSFLKFPELFQYATITTNNFLIHRDNYVECPDFVKYAEVASKLSQPIKGTLKVDLYEKRGQPGYGDGKCLGFLEEDMNLTTNESLDSQIAWSSYATHGIGSPSKEECSF